MQADDVLKSCEAFSKVLAGKIGPQLCAVAVYGSVVKGDYHSASSDHNVALVLKEDHADTLRGVAESMRQRRPSRRTGLLILTLHELERARDVFPLKLRDLSRHHKVVHGDAELLRELEVTRAHLVHDVEHQLRSLAIRLRRLFIRGESDPDLLRANLMGSFKGFAPPMAGLVELLGESEPRTKEDLIQATGRLLEVKVEGLSGLLRLTRDLAYEPTPVEVNRLLDGYERVLRTAARKADSLGSD